ncbi:MAG: iron ABC transporter permease [Thermoprotei archaeon]
MGNTIELYRSRVKRFFLSLATLLVLAVIVIILSLSIGSSMISPFEVFKAVFLKPFGYGISGQVYVIATLRVTRTIAAFSCGIALALAGLLMQTTTRNPLADPYIFGLSSTALTFIALAALISPVLVTSRYALVLIAFIGAMTGYVFTLILARLAGGSSLALVLAGIAIASLFSGLSFVLLYLVQSVLRAPFVYFLMGSASTVLAGDLAFLTYPLIPLTVVSMILYKPLNVYLYGDEYSRQLGYNPRITAVVASAIAAFSTALTISFVGIIGFIGLASPHIARFLVGSDHRFTIPITILVGGVLTTFSDIVARLVSIYSSGIGELPLGVITSIIGAPFLAYLVVRRERD